MQDVPDYKQIHDYEKQIQTYERGCSCLYCSPRSGDVQKSGLGGENSADSLTNLIVHNLWSYVQQEGALFSFYCTKSRVPELNSLEARLALEEYHVKLNQGLSWVRGGKKGKTAGGKNNNRRKTEDRLQLWKQGGQFVWAQITSSATRNQTAGSWRTWLSGFLQEGGKKEKRGCHVIGARGCQRHQSRPPVVPRRALSGARSSICEGPLIRFPCLPPWLSAGSALLPQSLDSDI